MAVLINNATPIGNRSGVKNFPCGWTADAQQRSQTVGCDTPASARIKVSHALTRAPAYPEKAILPSCGARCGISYNPLM